MKITLNGTTRSMTELGLSEKRLAVEVNLDIIPRSEHPSYQLKENDKVEVVHAIGGG